MRVRRLGFFLFFCGLAATAAARQTQPLDLGKIAIPQDFEHYTSVMLKGEYGLFLDLEGEELVIVSRHREDNLEYSFGLETTVEALREAAAVPRIEVDLVTREGQEHIRIRVFRELKSFTAYLRSSPETGERPEVRGKVDPAILTEVKLLAEAHALMEAYAGQVWPGWQGFRDLEYQITFPNRVLLIATANTRVPQSFERLPGIRLPGKTVYLDQSRAMKGRITGTLMIGAHGDAAGVTAFLSGGFIPDGTVSNKGANPEDEMMLERILTYVHEAFHCLQARFHLDRLKAGAPERGGRMARKFEVNLDYCVYAEIEGEALERALAEPERSRAVGFLKDALVARELKQRAMPPDAVFTDKMRTQSEGTATYANIRMAMLARETGRPSHPAARQAPLASAYRHLDEYIENGTGKEMSRVKSNTQATTERFYIYGAFQALVLDRLYPGWKEGFFENDRTLDEALAAALGLGPEDFGSVYERIGYDFDVEEIRARHDRSLKARESAIRAIRGRKGRRYRIDLKNAQGGFDIRPRGEAILTDDDQIYPRGLEGFDYGSLHLTSHETPMRLARTLLEWVETDAVPGQKSYLLEYDSTEGDLYKKVEIETKGFTLVAAAVRIIEDGDTVTIQIIDR